MKSSYLNLLCGQEGREAFYILNKEIFDYIDKDESCIFEQGPLENLVKDGQLQIFKHDGFWQCMDTYREFQLLNSLVDDSPWLSK